MTYWIGLFATLFSTPATAEDGDEAGWIRWGGPDGNFVVESDARLAESWPEGGPPVLWETEVGDGYSAVLHRDGRLFTMYREERVEIVVALDAATGEVVWDFAYEAGRYDDMTFNFGEGPNSTPLIVGDRIVSAGIDGRVHCLRTLDGEPLWSLDLHEAFGRQKRREEYGYSGIPLEYGGRVLVPVGGRHAVVALDPADGSVAWASGEGRVSYAPPRIVHLAGRDQLVYFSPTEVVGMDPSNGAFLWSYPVECSTENNLTSVILCEDDHLWVATQLDGGTRVLRVTEQDGALAADAVWTSRTVKQGHWNSIRVGDHLYGSLGDSNSMLGAVDWRTGEVLWKERGFLGAQALLADGKMIFVEEGGQVAMARVSPAGLEVLGAAQLLESVAWTAPTLVGTTLFVRDRRRLLALDLSVPGGEGG